MSLSYGRIIRKDINTSEGLLPESFETYQIVQPDDLVFRFTDLQNDKRSLRSGRVLERGIITSAYLAFRPVGMNARYFEYLMRAYDVSKVFYGMGGGLRQSLKYDDVRRMPILVPPRDTQRAIADFLDRETAKIDALIEKQSTLIDRLRERRKAIISSAIVGRGNRTPHLLTESPNLDEVLAPLPEGWTRIRLSRLVSIPVTAGADFSAEPFNSDVHLRYIRTTDLADLFTLIPLDSGVGITPSQAGGSLVQQGDLLATRSGSLGTSYLHQSYEVMAFAGYLVRIRLKEGRCLNRFLAWWTASDDHLDQVNLGATRSTIDNFSARKFSALRVPFPPLQDQHQIADHLDRETAKIDALISKAEQFIELTRERRSALITAAVTGQIDATEGVS